MIWGIITAAAFILSAMKFITARSGNKKADHAAMIIHRYSASLLIIVTVVHIVTVWKLREQRPAAMVMTGIVMSCAVLATLLSHMFAKRLGKSWLVIHRAATLVIAVGLVVHIVLGITSMADYKKKIAQLPERYDVDIPAEADGTYTGEYNAGYVEAYVSVTVKDGKLKNVDLLRHRTERGKPAEIITQRMIAEQDINVDAVSGATCSSKVIKEAVYRALTR